MSLIVQTRERLKEWGGWARGGMPNVPSMFAMIMRGSRGNADREPTRDVRQVDVVVRRADPDDREALVVKYVFRGEAAEKARMLDLCRRDYFRRLERAEWFVHVELDTVALEE